MYFSLLLNCVLGQIKKIYDNFDDDVVVYVVSMCHHVVSRCRLCSVKVRQSYRYFRII